MKQDLPISDVINEKIITENPEIANILYYRYLELYFFTTTLIEHYDYPRWKESFDFLLASYTGCLTPDFIILFGEALLNITPKCDTETEANLYCDNCELLSSIINKLLQNKSVEPTSSGR